MQIAQTVSPDAVSESPDACYHCGLPVPSGASFRVVIDAKQRDMCCAGCEAVAQAIVDNRLTDYYRHRDAMPEPVREARPAELEELGLFDHPEFQKDFVTPVGEHGREAMLILEGITCAACVWLNERQVSRLPGVSRVVVNYATRRASVRWDVRRTRLSEILAAIREIGYHAYPYDAERSEQLAQRERRTMLWRVAVAGLGMMQVMMYAYPAYIAAEGELTRDADLLMRWASLILTVPVVFYSAAPFFTRAWRDLKLRALGMDVPVALGVGSAFLASVWATLVDGPEVYFDSVTMFVFLLLLGRYLEMMARQKAVRGVEVLSRVLPSFAERIDAVGGSAVQVPVAQLVPGDRIRVSPGQVVPVDGRVLEGESRVNEAVLTGESAPVKKVPGAAVIGGSMNVASPLLIDVEKVGERTRLSAIQQLMERAAAERPQIATQADRVARVFIYALLSLAALTFVGWQLLDPTRALWVFVSVLVVACPCALSLATPTALTVATDALARMGLLVTRGHAVETLARATHFVFDKTGTLTQGHMRLTAVKPLGRLDAQALRATAAALEQGSEHAIARAIRLEVPTMSELPPVAGIKAVTGQGVEGVLDGVTLRLGRAEFVSRLHGQSLPKEFHAVQAEGATLVALGSESGWLGVFVLNDAVRPEAARLIRHLQRNGCRVSILSGDAPPTVKALARSLGVDDAHADMTPEAKQAWVAECQRRQGAVVAMVGDGVNDAPVLAQAQVSVAMGGGTDLARNQADMVLLSEDLGGLARASGLTRRALRIIRENLWWSFSYNFTSVPLAMAGLVTPWMAGIGMAGSSLLVVLNALRLQRGRGDAE